MTKIGGTVIIDKRHMSDALIDMVRRDCTIRYETMAEDGEQVLKTYSETETEMFIPRDYGRSCILLPEATENLTTDKRGQFPPEDYRKDPITPRDALQADFFEQIANVCKKDGVIDCLANARTGSGKTVASLALIRDLGTPTLVVVHTNRLKEQWIGNPGEKSGMRFFFGDSFADNCVGIVQQDECDYLGKHVVVGSLASLVSRKYPPEFYNYFGLVIFDEVHKMGAPEMSKVMSMFNARVRLGLTATNRRDALRAVCDLHLGKPKIVSGQSVLRPKVFNVVYTSKMNSYFMRFSSVARNMVITKLAEDPIRNDLLTKIIYDRGYKRNRNVVVLSDRISQLQILKKELMGKGVPENTIGLYVDKYKQRVYKDGKWVMKDVKVKEDEFKRITKECSIILATYGIFATGTDIPRIDFGVEATPRANQDQAIGRILRLYEGKPQPEWIGVEDKILLIDKNLWYKDIELVKYGRMNSYRRQQATQILNVDASSLL